MKTIRINEAQFQRLLEINGTEAPSFEGGDIKEFPGSEVSATTNISDVEGNPKYGKPKTTDKVQNDLTAQNYFINNSRRTTRF